MQQHPDQCHVEHGGVAQFHREQSPPRDVGRPSVHGGRVQEVPHPRRPLRQTLRVLRGRQRRGGQLGRGWLLSKWRLSTRPICLTIKNSEFWSNIVPNFSLLDRSFSSSLNLLNELIRNITLYFFAQLKHELPYFVHIYACFRPINLPIAVARYYGKLLITARNSNKQTA